MGVFGIEMKMSFTDRQEDLWNHWQSTTPLWGQHCLDESRQGCFVRGVTKIIKSFKNWFSNSFNIPRWQTNTEPKFACLFSHTAIVIQSFFPETLTLHRQFINPVWFKRESVDNRQIIMFFCHRKVWLERRMYFKIPLILIKVTYSAVKLLALRKE